ncbi:immunoglobulin domain-containing protein [Allomuricauda sp. R78024]|uniref:leucine-rich repeat domain-containing protein n=1 Tax=Allomuricauda sp. R78024 TaxID=3093867 RepID=UPI0037C5C8FF
MGKLNYLLASFILFFLGHVVQAQDVSTAERQALIDLYNATNGANWTNNTNWNTSALVTNWHGVTVVNDVVTELDLSSNLLSGSLPQNIDDLSGLININFDENQLSGAIPTSIGQLTNLEKLTLSRNQLSGSLPTELSQLTNLDLLALWDNNFTGTIPSSLSLLINLERLFLFSNQLSGTIPSSLGQLTSLLQLDLSNNQLTGSIPVELTQLSNLFLLSLFNNQLSGAIPIGLSQLNGLTLLLLGDNSLTGNVPDFTNNSLIRLEIQGNDFVFSHVESEHATYVSNFTTYAFSPQAKVDIEETLSVVENGSITLTSTALTSTNNSYQWYKDGVAIAGATSKDYVISNATATDAGVYYFEATNSVVTGLTLIRNDITLSVTAPTCGVSAAEKQALLDLYNSTNGANWTNTWDIVNDEPCDWYGVTVVNGEVSELKLSNNNLVGSIPNQIGQLVNLSRIDLSNNGSLNGAIPTEIGNLIGLLDLNLFTCNLSGVIPDEIGSLVNLTNLRLSGNSLSGAIPSSVGNLLNLRDFLAVGNNLTSIPNNIGDMVSLITLDLGNNNISGSIPTSIGNLSNLIHINLLNNQLTGNLPDEIGNLSNLISLLLSNNQLTGTIPTSLGNLSNLITLQVNTNNLTGTVPNTFGNLLNAQSLQLSGNNFFGDIPAAISNIPNLAAFNFFNNNFVFSNFETEHSNYEANLNYYNFSPQAKVDLEETLTVDENGTITLTSTALTSANNSYQWYKDGVVIAGATSKDYVISNATATDAGVYYFEATNSVVTGLTLTRNDITLSVTTTTCGVSAAEKQALLDLYNSTNGANWFNTWDIVNDEPCDWHGVTVSNGNVIKIQLHTNNMSGSIQASIGNLINLTDLSLPNNAITGEIPSTIGNLSNLTTLVLADNNLSGNIPIELGLLNSLAELNLFENQLTGIIPPEFGQLSNLSLLNLTGNQLTGSIPTQLSQLISLVELLLRDNQLSGSIPAELGQLSNLTILDFYSNQLTGSIPAELGQLSNLTELRLFDNQLTGSIPAELGQLSNLVEITLFNNQISGSIPIEINQLTNLALLNLQNNQLSGTIPDLLGLSLNFLILDNNAFIFSDFESEHSSYAASLFGYLFSPQAKVDQEETLYVEESGSITLTSTALTSANNSYQWYKDGVAIAGATNKDYIISNATATDAGVYHFTATNSVVTGLTLTRNDITLNLGTDSCGVSATEKQALLDLYNSTNGANWTNTLANNQPWDTNIPVCDWFGVTVVNGNVTVLNIGNNNLSGPIPASIGDLTDLTRLWLFSNQLTGSLPPSIGNLVNIRNIALNSNQLSGSFPLEIVSMTNLQSLSLSLNQFTGSIPAAFGQLTSLNYVSLGDNNFSGSIPMEMGNLTNLSSLFLNDNLFTGNIPPELANMTNLTGLALSNNQLTGSIPIELLNLPNLVDLRVNNNQLSGTIPDFTTTATPLSTLLIPINNFIFSDFESQHSDYVTGFSQYTFSPQAKVDAEEILTVQEFSNITLTSTVLTSTNNSYQWFKDGVAIAGATSKDYVIPNASATDAGVYYFEATNSVVTGLTLTRNDITLNVEPGSNTIVQQQFCATGGVPTVADLSIPTPAGVTAIWYPTQTGGTPLDQNETLQNDNTYWRDYTGNTIGRAGVEVNIDNLIPIGNPIQEFDAPTNPTLADIVVSLNPSSTASQVQWYASATSTTALANTTALQDGVSYFAAENATTCRLEIRVFLAILDVCTEVVYDTPQEPNALYGNFEGAANVIIANSRNESMGASGWTTTLGTPDTFSTPYSNTTDPYLQSSFTASQNGDICAGGLRFQNTAEAFGADIFGLNASTTYVVELYVANVTNVVNDAISNEAQGFWEITFAGTTKSTAAMAPSTSVATTWKRERLEFDTNSSTTQFMEFKVGSNATNQNNAYPVYMLIDGIRVYEKPQSTSSNPCALIEPQVFCNSDDDNQPTIGDLTSPSGNSVTWHSAPIDGTRYFESVELGSINETFVWADEGNGEARVPVEILLDFGAPFGDTYQSFDGNNSPTLADLVVEGINITWHSSYASIDVLPTSTPLTNDVIYYAAQDGNPCRLSVQVFVGIPTLVGDGNQEFCSSTNPTVGNLVMETTDPSYTLTWYDAETGGLAYNSTDSLVDGQTYYASQGNGADSSEERYPVRVSVIDTAEENKLYERDIQVASGTTIADITTFFELEPTILWYDFPQAGTAYPNTYTLIDGETYYARISEGLCDALEVLAVTVAIEDVTNPELVSCIKFIPQPGDRYVISGWVREHAATPVPANTLEFTEKESFIALLDHLTSKIFAQEDIPPVYELYKDPQAPNVNPLLPFIRNFTGTNVTVYDFQFETELIGLQEVAVGYSFALSPDNLYRFVYRTPLVAYQFNSPLPGGFNVVIFEDYHYPILNYVNLQIEYTDVAIVGNSFRITSNFNLSGATDSPYKTNFTGHTTDSDTDSGIEANVQLFDYVEEPQHMAMDYLNTSITLEYLDENGQAIILPNSNVLFQPKGAIIDGWQRISGDFTIPTNAANMKIYLKNDGSGLNAYFDDVRMHPFDSNLKSFVYDPVTQRLQAELDENNYATFYEYDSEGGLVRVKKETERGVYTIQETRSGNSKLNNGSE